jgi:hypothetical protein
MAAAMGARNALSAVPGTVSISAPGLREQCPICANGAPLWRFGIGPSILGDRGNPMLTLRTLAIVTIGAGVFAGLPLTGAQACDDDRYPCPIRVPQEVDAPAQAAPSAQPQKKASHAARPSEKAQAKREAPPAAARAKPSKPAAPEHSADSIAQKAAEAPPALVPSPPADQPLNAASRGESPVAAAGTAWPVLPTTEGAGASAPGAAPAATSADATEAAKTAAATTAVTNAVKVVDPNEANDLDRAAAASVQAESSWLTYLLLMLVTALAAASAFWFFARRAAPRVRMSNS